MITAIVRAGSAISKGSKLLPRSAAASKPVLASKSVKLAPSYPKVNAPKKGNGLVKRAPDALDFASSFASAFSDSSGTDTPKQKVKTKNCCDTLVPLVDSITKKLVSIDKLLKDELKLDRNDSAYKRKKKEKEQYKKQEEKLESPKKVKPKAKLSPSAPGLSIGERIKRFVMFTLLGWLVDKILPLLPKLAPVFSAIGKVISFSTELFGGLVSGLSKFLEFGIKLTNGLTKSLGFIAGARTEQEFSDFEKKFNRMVDLAILAAMLIGDSGGDLFDMFKRGNGKGGRTSTSRPRPGTGGRSKVTTSGGKGTGRFSRIREKITSPFRPRSKVTTTGGRQTGLGGVKERFTDPLRQKPRVTTTGGRQTGFAGRIKDLQDKITRPTAKITTSGGKSTGILSQIEELGNNFKKTISPTKITGAVENPGPLRGATEGAQKLLKSVNQNRVITGARGVLSKVKVPPAVGKVAGPIGTVLFAGLEYSGRKESGQTTSQAAIGTAASVAGGLAGAAGGAEIGALAGGAIGALFAGVGAVPGAAIGGIIGGILGGLGGSWAASSIADTATGANKAKPASVPKHEEGGVVKNTLGLDRSFPKWFESSNKNKVSTKSPIKIKLPQKKKPQTEKPGKDIGGYGEIVKIFPDPEGKVSGTGSSQGGVAATSGAQKQSGFNILNPFSWFSNSGSNTSSTPTPQPTQGQTQPNALFALTKASQSLKKIPFVGNLMGASVDIAMGQKPDRDLYQSMADSILYLGQKASEGQNKEIQTNIQKLATGGIASLTESSSSISLDAAKSATKTLRDSLAVAIELGANSALKNVKDEIISSDVRGKNIATRSLEPPDPNEGAPSGDSTGSQDGSQPSGDDPLVPGAPSGATPQVSGGNADFWTLVAIASREDSEPQSWADIAQSIYNRASVGMYTGGKNIKNIITAPGQYEPTFGNRKEWLAITDINTAATAAKKSVNQLKQVAAALKNPKLQAEAARFVGGRTDFMGESQKGSMKPDKGDVTRGPGDNYFGWFYNAKLKGPAKAPNLGDVAVTGGGGGSSNKPGSGKPESDEPVKPSGSKKFPLPKGVIGTGSGQVFGAPRSYGPHAGVDVVEKPPWQSDPKLPVVAYSSGKVVPSSPHYPYQSSGYTSNLTVDHGGGLKVTYLHTTPGLKVGDKVSAGQKVGKLIDLADATHLHFQAYKDNKLINPTGLLRGAAFEGTDDTKKGGLYLTHPNEAIVHKSTVSLLGKDFFKTLNNVENKTTLSKVAPDLIARINEVARGKSYSMGEPKEQDIQSGDPSLSSSSQSTKTTKNLEQFNKTEETKTEESQQKENKEDKNKKQKVQVIPASHPETGKGFAIRGVKDGNGRPLILSKGAITAFGEMMKDSKGVVKGSDVASGKRSPAQNKKVGGVKNSNHLGGNALDIHGTSMPWMRKKGKAYGWIVNDYPGSHGGHFDYKGKNSDDTFATMSSDIVTDSVIDSGGSSGAWSSGGGGSYDGGGGFSGGGSSGGGSSGGGGSYGGGSSGGGQNIPADSAGPQQDVDSEPSESLVPGSKSKGGANVNVSLTQNQREALRILGKYESASAGGYNAVNQIGISGGRGTTGYAGDFSKMKQHGGRNLTDMTVGEILDLQAERRGMSNEEWISQGRLHAVGRYQFIGNTLPGLVANSKIPRNAKFSEEVQDLLALQLMKERGISPWVGPSDHATPAERAIIEAARNDPIKASVKPKKSEGSEDGSPIDPNAADAKINDFTFGDSIASGLSNRIGKVGELKKDARGTSTVGASPKEVLRQLKAFDKNKLRGKVIRLSSGITNNPKDLKTVEEQLKYLNSIGAKVQLVGVSNNVPSNGPYAHIQKDMKGMNDKLKDLAEKYGGNTAFLGGFKPGADGIHPEDPLKLNKTFNNAIQARASGGSPKGGSNIKAGDFTIDTENDFLKAAGSGKLDYGTGGDGMCTTNVLLGLDKLGHSFAKEGTTADSSNPRGLVSQLIGKSGFASIPGLGNEQTIKSPYGNVKARVVPFADYQAAVEKGLIPSGAFIFSTRHSSWNAQTGSSSGFDTAISRDGGRIAWNGNGSQGNAIYGSGTQSVIVLVPRSAIKEKAKPGQQAKPGQPARPGAKPGAKPKGGSKGNWLQSLASNVGGLLSGKKKLSIVKAEGGGQIDSSGIIARPKTPDVGKFASYEDPSGPAPHIIIVPSPAKQQQEPQKPKGASPSGGSSKSSDKYYSQARRK